MSITYGLLGDFANLHGCKHKRKHKMVVTNYYHEKRNIWDKSSLSYPKVKLLIIIMLYDGFSNTFYDRVRFLRLRFILHYTFMYMWNTGLRYTYVNLFLEMKYLSGLVMLHIYLQTGMCFFLSLLLYTWT